MIVIPSKFTVDFSDIEKIPRYASLKKSFKSLFKRQKTKNINLKALHEVTELK